VTERDFEHFLRAGLREMPDDAAPSALRASVLGIPAVLGPVPHGRVVGGWRFPALNRFAPILLAATAVIAAILIGILARSPEVGPTPIPGPTNSAESSGGAISPKPSSSDRIGAIAYVTQSGLSSLYIVLPDKEPLQLAPSGTVGNDVVCPSFSPDGTGLALGMPGGTIVVLSIDDQGHTGDAVRLDGHASETPHCAAWAPDSSAVAFLDGSALVIVPLAGEPQRIDGWDVATSGGATFGIDYPADRAVQWSPNGSVIAVARPSGTWLVPIDGAAPRRLHETPTFSVSWSPDATRLVVGAGGPKALVIRAADGTTLTELPTGYGPPVWSPTEDRIALSDADAGLVVVRADGTDRLVIDDYGYHPTWSPDGRQLIYIQDAASAAWRLMMADAAGSGAPTTIVDSVAISSARSFPAAEQITWQPVKP
jgi:Tol biopolymer transport system component